MRHRHRGARWIADVVGVASSAVAAVNYLAAGRLSALRLGS
ncbi:MAG: hypothetical protein OXE75_00070 [bacterium]|nr:hypothetical protein [bacterium]